MCVIGVLILGLAVLKLFHQNNTATRGYTLRTLEAERAELSYQEEVLTTKLAEMRSLDALLGHQEITSMSPSANPTFVQDTTSVAINKQEL
jgi:hypothetical protein